MSNIYLTRSDEILSVKVRYSYLSEEEAKLVATWLASKCSDQCGGDWLPYWHQNINWFASARLGDPYLASISVSSSRDRLLFFGGFVADIGKPGWLDGESSHGDSPAEVLVKSHNAIVSKYKRHLKRLREIHSLPWKIGKKKKKSRGK